jgi:hypothetical protein
MTRTPYFSKDRKKANVKRQNPAYFPCDQSASAHGERQASMFIITLPDSSGSTGAAMMYLSRSLGSTIAELPSIAICASSNRAGAAVFLA